MDNTQLDALCSKVAVAIEDSQSMKLAYPESIGSVTLSYCRQGWQMTVKVIYKGKRRTSEIFGDGCATPEEAAASLINSLPFWVEAGKK